MTTQQQPMDGESRGPALARTMGLWALVIYGVGDMLGAGIYGLIGAAARDMGNMVWLAFTCSMAAAMLTGLSYACLGSRYPRAAGAAYISQRAFGWPFLSYTVGLTAMASGLTSMGTASRAFAEYFGNFVPGAAPWVIILGFIGFLTLVNFWGMRESTWLNAVCTFVEAGGLVFVIIVGVRYWGSVNYLDATSTTNPTGHLTIPFLLQGAVLTFYAFIGFEDMINVSEEVKDVRTTFPKGIIIALLITNVVYMAVGITAVSVVPHGELAAVQGHVSKGQGPLVKVVSVAAPWMSTKVFAAISLFAIANTALLNYIMGSRLVYGMARQKLLPGFLGKVHPVRRTPHVAIFVLMVIVVTLALSGDISQLAKATAILLLGVFVVINGALIVLRRRAGEPAGAFEVPVIVPVGGIVVCLAMIVAPAFSHKWEWKPPAIAGGILGVIALMYLIMRPRNLSEKTLEELGE